MSQPISPNSDKFEIHYRQQLSALIDGELPADEARFLLRRLQHDDELSGCHERWQLCGDVLRGMASAPAGAASAQWKGVLNAGGSVLRVTAARDGEMLRLRFGEPQNCAIPAELLDEGGSSATFRFNLSANGGAFCTGLYPGEVRTSVEDGRLRLSFERKGRGWEGVLAPIAGP